MLKELKFVQGAVARKDFVPELTHFRISGGRIEGFNGQLALSAPIDLDIEAMPKAVPFTKAIERLPDADAVTLNLTKSGKVTVKSGNFRVHVDCWNDDHFPRVIPEGDIIPLPGGILPALGKIAPFMGVDASRPWAMGILLDGRSAFATNNIVLIQYWLPFEFPTPIGIPAMAIKEMLRIGREPCSVQLEPGRLTFHYDDTSWLSTSVSALEWPDIERVISRGGAPHNALPVPPGFFEALDRLGAFATVNNRAYLRGGTIATTGHEGEGAAITLDDFGGIGCHFMAQLASLASVAEKIDFGAYPLPCPFFGDKIRGIILGLRVADAV